LSCQAGWRSPTTVLFPADELTALVVILWRGFASMAMIDGHYDENADISWLRFEGYNPATVVAEETEFGLRELDPGDMHMVGLEYRCASDALPGITNAQARSTTLQARAARAVA
jgi:hypothetical protein